MDSSSKDHLNNQKPQESIPDWTTIPIKPTESWDPFTFRPPVLFFDPYVVFVAPNWKPVFTKEEKKSRKQAYENAVSFFAIDLRDNSFQETKFKDKDGLFFYDRSKYEIAPFTLTKYGENQIIKFGKAEEKTPMLTLITIESFQPFKVKCENIKTEGTPEKECHTAQIYNDALYVFGGCEGKKFSTDIWKFDLKNYKWELLEATGKGPKGKLGTDSFIYEEDLYIYECNSPKEYIFKLNLETLKWKKIPKKKHQLLHKEQMLCQKLDQSIYQGNLLFIDYHSTKLSCWDLDTNSFKSFDIKKNKACLCHTAVVYKDKYLVFGYYNEVEIFCLNLQDFDLQPVGLEEQRFRSLFMSQEESDVTLKVQDKLIPSHKEVLIKRSRYFAGLFNSGMSESRESVIEIQDCDSEIFQEFLRFLYTREVQLNDDLAKKLIILADKYVQNDLNEKCVDFLKLKMSSENVYETLDFAEEQNLVELKNFSSNFLMMKLDVDNLSKVIHYLFDKQDSFLEIKSFASSFIVNRFAKIHKKHENDWKFVENFLIKNVDMSTISLFVNFIYWKDSEIIKEKEDFEESKGLILQKTANLKLACFAFAKRNFREILSKGISADLPNRFLADLALFIMNPTQLNN